MSGSKARLLIILALCALVAFAVASQLHRGPTWTPEELADPNIEVGVTVRIAGRVVGSDASNSLIIASEGEAEPTAHVILTSSQNRRPAIGEDVIIEGMIVQPGSLENGVVISSGAPSK